MRDRVLLLTTHLGGGGAEMQVVRLASHIDRERFEVSVAVRRKGGSYEEMLAPDVPLRTLGSGSFAGDVLALRRLIAAERPAVVCAFLDHVSILALLAVAGLPRRDRPRVIACVQAPPSWVHRRDWRSRVTRRLMRLLFPRADRVVALSQGVADDVEAFLPALRGRVDVVYNAGSDPVAAAAPLNSDLERPGLLVLACGRLHPQKGYPHLLRAFARVTAETGAHLWILGEGSERPALERLAGELGIAPVVSFLGFRRNPQRFMALSDLFVLSSVYEGFANVLVEAMASGTAVVSFDCPHGPAEIIRDGESGVLVPVGDEDALAAEIVRLLRDPALRASLARAGKARAAEFSAAASAAGYERVLANVLGRPAA